MPVLCVCVCVRAPVGVGREHPWACALPGLHFPGVDRQSVLFLLGIFCVPASEFPKPLPWHVGHSRFFTPIVVKGTPPSIKLDLWRPGSGSGGARLGKQGQAAGGTHVGLRLPGETRSAAHPGRPLGGGGGRAGSGGDAGTRKGLNSYEVPYVWPLPCPTPPPIPSVDRPHPVPTLPHKSTGLGSPASPSGTVWPAPASSEVGPLTLGQSRGHRGRALSARISVATAGST